MKTILIGLSIIAILIISGCTMLSDNACKPNWIQSGTFNLPAQKDINDACETRCHNYYNVTNYKLENETATGIFGTKIDFAVCYCDANNC